MDQRSLWAVLFFGLASPAWAATSTTVTSPDCMRLQKAIDNNWDDSAIKLELQRLFYNKRCPLPTQPSAAAAPKAAASRQANVASSVDLKSDPTRPPKDAEPSTQLRFLLRQDFADVGLITDPSSNSSASGAAFGYSNDRVADNVAWTVHGTAIAALNFDNGFGPHETINLVAGSVGIYGGLNKTTNSNKKSTSQNIDTDVFGGFLELGFDHIFGGDQWLRLKVGAVNDNLKNTSAVSTTLEWIPVYSDLLIHWPYFFSTPWTQVGVRFDPQLKLQLDDDVNRTVLFSNHKDALRIGPQFGLWIQPFADIEYLSNLNINLVYHPYYETYSAAYLSWFQTSITYNLDPNGMLGITGTYQKGRDENNGTSVDLFKLTLTGKLDYCTAWCPPPKP